jgi:hypothetical protein
MRGATSPLDLRALLPLGMIDTGGDSPADPDAKSRGRSIPLWPIHV